ncbi:hypothetical protein PGT21_015116 [Puccinia graminis f. sp. tritici]|uniref:Uncharacterized protein n=1 Tax=Puccinia graminis f. sp. tritici TaxID=56615 RepID=A0A5B0RLH8_PUCGR|nr:hypothetical protein PGT21_015116 [Puccinia graminis f. sp. tritici]KAA1126142.1 hypothetical protein PGTUg99_028654 [Puccinia graminis f. sp. tritici]
MVAYPTSQWRRLCKAVHMVSPNKQSVEVPSLDPSWSEYGCKDFWIAIPEESDNKIMEISNIPEPISKRKKKAYKPSTEEPTVVHHSIKQCGNGHLVASSPPE